MNAVIDFIMFFIFISKHVLQLSFDLEIYSLVWL